MNENHVQQVFSHYIDRFEEINTEHGESYKWEIAKKFKPLMDEALNAPSEEFSAKLYEVKKLSSNIIDSYTQPFYGLVKFAEEEPETVRNMFKALYADGGNDPIERQHRVANFLQESHALREKYFPDSYLYKDDVHSITGYLFLYDPDHNYIYKATHALIFADCIEFYDDWGNGDTVDLSVYYRMCDQLVERIKDSKELMATDASRFALSDEMHPDAEKHILAFDLIYCCSTYGLFSGISFVRPKSKERQLMQERKEKAIELSAKNDEAQAKLQELNQAKEYVRSVLTEGMFVSHRMYGDGKIKSNDESSITVDFPEEGEKKLGEYVSIANGIISVQDTDIQAKLNTLQDILKKENSIKAAASYAENELAKYAEYLD